MSSPTANSVTCGCCNETITYQLQSELFEEAGIGFLCKDCRYNMRIAKAWLKHTGLKEESHRPEGNPNL